MMKLIAAVAADDLSFANGGFQGKGLTALDQCWPSTFPGPQAGRQKLHVEVQPSHALTPSAESR